MLFIAGDIVDDGRSGADVVVHGASRDRVDRVAAQPSPGRGDLHRGGQHLGRDAAAQALRDEERERARILADGRPLLARKRHVPQDGA